MKNWFSLLSHVWRRSVCVGVCGLMLSGLSGLRAQEDKIASDLERAMEQSGEPVPVLVMLKPFQALPLTLLGESVSTADVERIMRARALEGQMEMREWVNQVVSTPMITGDSSLRRYKFFWNVNGFMATVSQDLIAELADREDVDRIVLDRTISLYKESVVEVAQESAGEFTYGLTKVGVPQLREKHSDLNGNGVVVGILDTGLDTAHPEFKGRKVIFKDFTDSKKTGAFDDNGHGTHVAGTIGGNGSGGTHIGVAPGVSFVIGKIFGASGRATLSGIMRGMEWVLNPDGNPDTNDKPRVVNNSWGGGFTSDLSKDPFNQAVMSWLQMDVFPSFAAGNSGPRAGTVGSPGGLPAAFGVGATDSNDAIASFSSRGPLKAIVDGKQVVLNKPDISAPGVDVYSSLPGGKYGKYSGTSMATPHITGVIALLYQFKPTLKVAEIRDLLMKTSEDLGDKGHDHSFGAGRVNIFKAVSTMESELEVDSDAQFEQDDVDLEVLEDWNI